MSTPTLAMRLIAAWSAGDTIASRLGLLRSTFIYYRPRFNRRTAWLYQQFMSPGDLVFDVGSHLGNRILMWRQLGAAVVAFEPQPTCIRLLNKWYGSDPQVTLVSAALGSKSGEDTLHISQKTPTVTTLSPTWQNAVQQADSFSNVEWERQVQVPVSTLDEQVAQYGLPSFCKIDVEGYEVEVLRGLSLPISALSIEYIPATPSETLACINRLMALGSYEFNWSTGETHRLQSEQWLNNTEIAEVITNMEVNDDSGDLYARLTAPS